MLKLIVLSSLMMIFNAAHAQNGPLWRGDWRSLIYSSLTNIIDHKMKGHQLSDINFYYAAGVLTKKIGQATINLIETENGEFKLKINGSIKILGHGINLNSSLTQRELENEVAINFYVGGDSSVLELIPEPGFSQDGGDIKIWYKGEDGEWYSVAMSIRKVANKFKLFVRKKSFYPEVTSMDITISGYSLESMGVKKLQIIQ
jgi:hypothetical protein